MCLSRPRSGNRIPQHPPLGQTARSDRRQASDRPPDRPQSGPRTRPCRPFGLDICCRIRGEHLVVDTLICLQSGLPISLAGDVPTATVTTALCPRRVEVTSPGLRLNDQVAQHLALSLYATWKAAARATSERPAISPASMLGLIVDHAITRLTISVQLCRLSALASAHRPLDCLGRRRTQRRRTRWNGSRQQTTPGSRAQSTNPEIRARITKSTQRPKGWSQCLTPQRNR